MSAKVEYNIPGGASKVHPPSKPVWFADLDVAKNTPFPDGCKSAVAKSDEGKSDEGTWLGTKFGSNVDWVEDKK